MEYAAIQWVNSESVNHETKWPYSDYNFNVMVDWLKKIEWWSTDRTDTFLEEPQGEVHLQETKYLLSNKFYACIFSKSWYVCNAAWEPAELWSRWYLTGWMFQTRLLLGWHSLGGTLVFLPRRWVCRIFIWLMISWVKIRRFIILISWWWYENKKNILVKNGTRYHWLFQQTGQKKTWSHITGD